MSEIQELHIDELVQTLNEHEVAYFVIGGVAVGVHGYPRATKDLDIVPLPGAANLARLARALHSIHAEILESHDFDPSEMPARLDAEGLAMGGNWCLRTNLGRIDVLQYVDQVMETDQEIVEMAARATESALAAVPALIVSLDDLLRFKRRAGREIDLIDIRALHEANGTDTID